MEFESVSLLSYLNAQVWMQDGYRTHLLKPAAIALVIPILLLVVMMIMLTKTDG
jgi:hypothetical protein